jgi:hypothetical protein
MATSFPTGLDALTNPTGSSSLTSPDHAGQHTDANDAIEALQAKVGVNGSAVTSSLDYKITNINASNLTSGTVPSARVTGSYTGITGLGTLTSLTVTPSNLSSFTLGNTTFTSYSGITGDKGYLLVGNSVADSAIYLRSTGTGGVKLGALNSNTLEVGNGTVTVAGTMNATTFVGALTGNVTGNVTGSAATVTGASQTAITALGSLSTLLVGKVCSTTTVAAANDTGSFSVRGNASFPAVMSFHRTGAYAVNFGLSTDHKMELGGWSAGGIKFSVNMTNGDVTAVGGLNAYSISGNSNVAGTGNASYHPSGIYSTGTNWLYGTLITNGNAIGSPAQYCGAIYSNNWFRSAGASGWYAESYGAGIYSKAFKEVWTYNGSRFIASNNSNSSHYTSQQLEVRSNDLWSGGSVAGISFHVYGYNAPVLRYWTGTGAGLDVGNEGGTGYWYMGANNFVTRSSMRWKTDIRRRPQEQIVEVGLRLLEGETAIWDSKDIEPIFDEENDCYVQPSAEQRELVKDDWVQRRHFNKRGYIVEEIEKVFPEAVHYESDGKPSGVDYGVITTELVDILKLVVLQNDDQQRRIELLENKQRKLETV